MHTLNQWQQVKSASPLVDNIRAMMTNWRIRRKIIRTVLSCIVAYTIVVHSDTHTYEQFLKMTVGIRFL